jgi:hypothetical protein
MNSLRIILITCAVSVVSFRNLNFDIVENFGGHEFRHSTFGQKNVLLSTIFEVRNTGKNSQYSKGSKIQTICMALVGTSVL